MARTVTHNGIVAIRDEFRRTWRILQQVGRGRSPEADLFEQVIDVAPPSAVKEDELNGVAQDKTVAVTDSVAQGLAENLAGAKIDDRVDNTTPVVAMVGDKGGKAASNMSLFL